MYNTLSRNNDEVSRYNDLHWGIAYVHVQHIISLIRLLSRMYDRLSLDNDLVSHENDLSRMYNILSRKSDLVYFTYDLLYYIRHT